MDVFPWIGQIDLALVLTSPIVLCLGAYTVEGLTPTSLKNDDLLISIFSSPSEAVIDADKRSLLSMAMTLPGTVIIFSGLSVLFAVIFLLSYLYSGLLTFCAAFLIEQLVGFFIASYEIKKGWEVVVPFNAFLLIIVLISSSLKRCSLIIKKHRAFTQSLDDHFFKSRFSSGEVTSMSTENYEELKRMNLKEC